MVATFQTGRRTLRMYNARMPSGNRIDAQKPQTGAQNLATKKATAMATKISVN